MKFTKIIKNNKYLSILACLFLLIGCSGDDNFTEPKLSEEVKSFTTFTATLQDKPETRAYLTSADDSKKSVYWEEGDAIYVYSDEDQDLHLYKLISIGDDNTATFGGTAIKGNTFYAIFQPSNSPQPEVNGSIVNFSNVLGVATGFGDNPRYDFNGIMVASSQGNNFRFKQTLGILNFRISGIHEFSGINFFGNDHEVINGPGYIDLSEERPIYRLDDNSANSWYYSCIFDNKIVDDNTFNFCLIIPPTTFENGFTITFIGHDKDGKELQLEKSINRKVDVGVATITSYSLVDINAELKELETIHFEDSEVKAICVANWDTDGDGELSYSEAAAVTDIGLKFNAKTNIEHFTEFKFFVGLTNIPQEAFSSCVSLKSITLPNNTITIGDLAFWGCKSLKKMDFPETILSIGRGAFSECSDLSELVLPINLYEIKEAAFESCSNLKEIIIADNVVTIGEKAFRYCESLEEVTIPKNTRTIEKELFNGCSNLRKINFHDGVTSIGYESFVNCINLEKVELPESLTSIGTYAFESCQSLKSITIPNSVTEIGSEAFGNCSNLTDVILSNSLLSIDDHTFVRCTNLKNIILPESLYQIGWGAFSDCSSLETITIPDNVVIIADDAFLSCTNLRSINIPEGVEIIYSRAFGVCSNLNSITIPSTVTEIQNNAFAGCTNLNSIIIPENVKTIGDNVFKSCDNLNSIICKATTPPALEYVPNYYYFSSEVILGWPGNGTIYVPITSIDIYKTANGWKEYADRIQAIPE